jgi:AcrR family transcriptional regulator
MARRKSETPRKRPGGRSARVRSDVLQATLEELADVGYGELSFERVADRAGVHKTTLYRRWENKENLILEAMLERGRDRIPIPDTGSLSSDLAELGKEIIANLSDPGVQATTRTVASIRDRDSAIAELGRRFWRARVELASAILDQAKTRGEIPSQVEPGLLIEALSAPIYFRLLLTDEPLDDEFVEQLAKRVASVGKSRPR